MGMTRRELLVGAGAVGALTFALPSSLLRGAGAAAPDDAVLIAYAATLVPGPGDDPEGSPGAVEADAVPQLYAQVPYVLPFIVADVSGAALAAHAQPFEDLAYAEREALLVAAFADDTRSPYHLIALAVGAGTFYGDFRNHVGGEHLGFPGSSDGYLATYTDRTGHGQPEGEAVPV
jgi:hypothetical protein